MIRGKKIKSYIVNGQRLVKESDFDKYLIFNRKNIEENVKKILKYDHLKGNIKDESYILSKSIIIENSGFSLYDLSGNKISDTYDDAYPFLGESMFYITNQIKQGNDCCKIVEVYGILSEDNKILLEIEDSFEGLNELKQYIIEESISFDNYIVNNENGRVGFNDLNNKKIISPHYEKGYYKNDCFIMQNGNNVYIFDCLGNNLVLNNKIDKICNNIMDKFHLNGLSNFSDLDLLYKLFYLTNFLDKLGFLYDLENDEIVKAERIENGLILSDESGRQIVDYKCASILFENKTKKVRKLKKSI